MALASQRSLVQLLVCGAVRRAAADAAPKPDTYLCPHATAGAVDCFLQATEHLYTMCRQVKSIEIIEFGYEKSDEGTNGAKTEYCVDKHRQSITRPYQAALREATGSRVALEGLRGLHEVWLISLVELKWQSRRKRRRLQDARCKAYTSRSERARVHSSDRAARRPTAVKESRPRGQAATSRRRRRARRAEAGTNCVRRANRACPTPLSATSSARGDFRRRRNARPRASGFPLPSAATRDGRGSRARRDRRAARRRGRHRHRQDLRLSRAGAAVRRQGDRLDRHQDAAGSALPARSAAHPRCVEGAGVGRAAQGPRQLRLPPSSRSARRPKAACRRATMRGTCRRSSRSRARPSAAIAASSPTCRKMRRSGRSSPRRATTASARAARFTPIAS